MDRKESKMFKSKLIHLCLGLVAAIALAVPSASTALAAPPANDNFADAQVITELPFSISVDITEATTEPDEPQPCGYLPWTVWFSYTPATDVVLRADMEGTQIWATLRVYRAVGPNITDLEYMDCVDYDRPSFTFTAEAGVAY